MKLVSLWTKNPVTLPLAVTITMQVKTKQTIILIPQPVKNYRQILDFMKLFYSDGETMKRLISIGRIKEILK